MSERLSVFDMFKVGVGPSSSHTLGPWRAALAFVDELDTSHDLRHVASLRIDLYGALAKTGHGHGTDLAVQAGLLGLDPETCDTSDLQKAVRRIAETHRIEIRGRDAIDFKPASDIRFHPLQQLPFHPNALTFSADLVTGETRAGTWYSIGGGFIVRDGETPSTSDAAKLPYPIDTAADLLKWCDKHGLARVARGVGERAGLAACSGDARRPHAHLARHAGLHLPRLSFTRRAAGRARRPPPCAGARAAPAGWARAGALAASRQVARRRSRRRRHFSYILDWVSCFALAVNEENACFGRVVTAPTNGAAGVIPAVGQYLDDVRAACWRCRSTTGRSTSTHSSRLPILRYLLTASEIGCIFKKGATISAAMGGCQAEIGVSSAMAAAGLAECLGGSPRQVLMAAEIAMEHHLGMTCDPVGGLVQVPCIERNAMGAIKAITAAQLACQSDPARAKVSLDQVVQTMWRTALDMSAKYKETADGGTRDRGQPA